MHKSLIVAGNFNMTNSKRLFNDLVEIGQHPKEMTDTVTVMEKIGHFLEDEVSDTYKKAKEAGFNKKETSPFIEEHLDIQRILKRSSKNWDGGYAMAGLLGQGDAFVLRDPSGIRPASCPHLLHLYSALLVCKLYSGWGMKGCVLTIHSLIDSWW